MATSTEMSTMKPIQRTKPTANSVVTSDTVGCCVTSAWCTVAAARCSSVPA